MGSWQKKKLVQNLHKLLTMEKPINIIQDKNYQSDFDRLMAETAETKLNTTRVSNFFIEIRVVSYAENLDLLGFSVFLYFHAVFVK